MRVLVSGAGGDIGQSIAKILNSYFRDADVIGSDIHNDFLHGDLFRQVRVLPPVSYPEYIEHLSQYIYEEDVSLFIPTSEAELRWFTENHHLGQSLSCHCLMPSLKAMRIGFDKLLTAQHLAANGLPSPWTLLASESETGPPEMPCILKSRYGAGNSSVYLIDNYTKARYFRKLYPDYIWQQFLPLSDGEFTCGVYRCLDGSTRVVVMKRRLAAGVTVFAEVINNQHIEALCTQISESLDLYGSINIQLRLIEGVGPMVFEINPRFSSTVGMRHRLGFRDLIWSIEEQFLNTCASPTPICWPKVRLARRYEELYDWQ